MTTLLPCPTSDPASDDVLWRQLRPRLWVGRAADEPLGMIERGRRFTATDADGEVRGGYRTLEAAQAALTGQLPIVAPTTESTRSLSPLAAWTTGAMLVAVALSTAALAFLR